VRLVIRNKPSQGLATLGQKLTQLPPDTLGDVFDNILVEPTATFWRLWESDELLLKVGGFLLAYVYRLEGLRGA
jgi:hypothetical protein